MAEIYFPYKTLEEKQGIIDANTDKTPLRDEVLGSKRFLVYDDGAEPAFAIPAHEAVKQAFIVMLGYLEEVATNPSSWTKTPAEFLADVKARL